MKSPTSSVGRIDEDGILNGSATNERSRKTIRSTGKKLFGYSIHQGSRASGGRCLAKYSLSASAITPVATVATNKINAKFMAGAFVLVSVRCRARHRGGLPSRSPHCPMARRDDAAGKPRPATGSRRAVGKCSLVADLEDGEECLLRNLHAADGLHSFLSGLLLLEQLLLACDVAAVALGEDV